jgi:hypothetical protein
MEVKPRNWSAESRLAVVHEAARRLEADAERRWLEVVTKVHPPAVFACNPLEGDPDGRG